MENQNDENPQEGDILESKEQEDNTPEDDIDWKAKAMEQEAEAKKWRGIAKRNETKLSKKEKTPEPEPKNEPVAESNKETLDYGQLAYLAAKGYDHDDDVDFLEKAVKRTGESLKDLLKDEFILNRLKSNKQNRDVQKATPRASKRGAAGTGRDSVDYWIQKGELPPIEQSELRRKVVNAKIKKNSGNKFTDIPVSTG